ncbi:MAG TPA: hypothetical protein VHZ95_22695 [Polyangiales bacterium]|nr:hypothetical protein [Polyangiales bacterium]
MPRSTLKSMRLVLQLMAASATVLARSNLTHAEESPNLPSAATSLRPERASGNLALEIVLGTFGVTIGTALVYAIQIGPAPSRCGGGDVPDGCEFIRPLSSGLLFGGLVPALSIGSVMLGGSVSGGEGRLGATSAGAYVAGFVTFLASAELGDSIRDKRLLFPITGAGVLLGSILGYRLFAHRRVVGANANAGRWIALPSVSAHSASLMVGGEL